MQHKLIIIYPKIIILTYRLICMFTKNYDRDFCVRHNSGIDPKLSKAIPSTFVNVNFRLIYPAWYIWLNKGRFVQTLLLIPWQVPQKLSLFLHCTNNTANTTTTTISKTNIPICIASYILLLHHII